MKTMLLSFLLLLQLNAVFSQHIHSDSISITYIANEGFLISGGNEKILIDGIFNNGWGKYHTPTQQILTQERDALSPFDSLTVLLASHNHEDHINPYYVAEHMVNDENSVLICPIQVNNLLKQLSDYKYFKNRAVALTPSNNTVTDTLIQNIKFKIISLQHPDDSNNEIQNIGFIFNINGFNIFHTGDAISDNLSDYQNLNIAGDSIDIAFLPRWFFNAEYGDKGTEIIKYIKPKAIIAMHVNTDKYTYYKNLVKNIQDIPPVYFMESQMERLNFKKDDSISDYFGQTPPGDKAVIFAPGILSLTNRMEAGITFSPDGKECFFEVAKPDPPYTNKFYYTKRVNNSWTEQIETPFSANNDNYFINPHFSVNGQKLFFTKLTAEYTNGDIYMIERNADGWGDPQRLPEPINSASEEFGYSETTDSVAYFSSQRSGGMGYGDIWCKRPSSNQPENLGVNINSSTDETEPCIAPDGSYIIYGTARDNSTGQLYVSFRKANNEWTKAINMNKGGAQINSKTYHQMKPSLSPDGKYLFFGRHEYGLLVMDIYWVSTHVLVDLKKSAFDLKLSKQIPDMIIKTDSVFNYIIPANTFSYKEGSETLKYTATLSNGLPLPSWLTFNADTRTLSGTPNQAEIDSVKITASYTDDISATCTFIITVETKTGMIRPERQNIKIFPNPTSGLFSISLGTMPQKTVQAEIYTTEGRLILTKEFRNTTEATVDLSTYPDGMYLIKFFYEGFNYEEKIIKSTAL